MRPNNGVHSPFPIHTMVTTHRFPTLKSMSLVVPVVTVIAVGSYTIFRYRKLLAMSRKAALAADLLCSSDTLAEDCVEVDEAVEAAWYEEHLLRVGPKDIFQDEVEDATLPGKASVASSTVKYDSEDRKVSEHLVVRERKRYMQSVIAEAKTRFGKPDRTSANVLAVRKYVGDAMRKHRVRPTHVARMLPIVVECVFMESESEREARQLVEAVQAMSGAKWWRTLRWLMGRGYMPTIPHQVA